MTINDGHRAKLDKWVDISGCTAKETMAAINEVIVDMKKVGSAKKYMGSLRYRALGNVYVTREWGGEENLTELRMDMAGSLSPRPRRISLTRKEWLEWAEFFSRFDQHIFTDMHDLGLVIYELVRTVDALRRAEIMAPNGRLAKFIGAASTQPKR